MIQFPKTSKMPRPCVAVWYAVSLKLCTAYPALFGGLM